MAWIRVIDEGEAGSELQEVYEQVKGNRGKIANVMKIHSLNPPSMKAHMDLYVGLMFGPSGLKREERELIAVAVSSMNGCEYCVRHHAEALNHYWKDEERLEKLVRDFRSVELPSRVRAILNYAVKLTKSVGEVDETDIGKLRGNGLSDEDILDINLIASYFNFVNRVVEGLGVEFTPEEVAGYKY